MGVKIHIPADKVWQFFFENRERCVKEMIEIASNDETGYAVYITEDSGYPMFLVCCEDGEPECEVGAISQKDCTEIAEKFFACYLFPVVEKRELAEDEGYDAQRQELEDEIYEREDELRLALCDFLQVASEGADTFDHDEPDVSEMLDYILEYLAVERCLSVRRPTFITDPNTGEEYYAEYPYDIDILC